MFAQISHFKRLQQHTFIASLRKVFILTTSGKQSSNYYEYITEKKIKF